MTVDKLIKFCSSVSAFINSVAIKAQTDKMTFDGSNNIRSNIAELKSLIENHKKYTNSGVADKILENWDESLKQFIKVYPTDYRRVQEKRNSK